MLSENARDEILQRLDKVEESLIDLDQYISETYARVHVQSFIDAILLNIKDLKDDIYFA